MQKQGESHTIPYYLSVEYRKKDLHARIFEKVGRGRGMSAPASHNVIGGKPTRHLSNPGQRYFYQKIEETHSGCPAWESNPEPNIIDTDTRTIDHGENRRCLKFTYLIMLGTTYI